MQELGNFYLEIKKSFSFENKKSMQFRMISDTFSGNNEMYKELYGFYFI